jgi:hypothetical protein
MLACIACSAKEGGEDGSRAAVTPAVKSLTSQVRACPTRLSHPLQQLLYMLLLARRIDSTGVPFFNTCRYYLFISLPLYMQCLCVSMVDIATQRGKWRNANGDERLLALMSYSTCYSIVQRSF